MQAPTQDWPVSVTAPPTRRAGWNARVVPWVLVVSAFLCGVAVSGALFAVAWRSQVHRTDVAHARLGRQQVRLNAASATEARLRRTLVHERRRRLKATGRLAAAAAENHRLLRSRGALAASAQSLGRAASPLPGELRTIASYVQGSPNLDAGYLRAQVMYVERQAREIVNGASTVARLSR